MSTGATSGRPGGVQSEPGEARPRRDTLVGAAPAPWGERSSHLDPHEPPSEEPTAVDTAPYGLVDPDVPRLAPEPAFAERYVPAETLGEGGMGLVRLHLDRQIGRAVAMKTLHPERARPDTRARFVREARIQGQLEHPSVVPVYDLALDAEGEPFFTMRPVRGLTLKRILAELSLGAPESFRRQHSRRRLLTSFSRVCLAIDYAHRHGVLHRDLKPSNIILGDFGEVYVLDWGLAGLRRDEAATTPLRSVRLARPTAAGAILGTPAYMSPEQLMGRVDELTPASDIYALGAILFEILALAPLHTAAGGDLYRTEQTEKARRPSVRAPERNVAPELDRIVLRATEPSPSQRHPSARALHAAIEAFLDTEQGEHSRAEHAAERAREAHRLVHEVSTADPPSGERRAKALSLAVAALSLDPANPTAREAARELLAATEAPPPEPVRARLSGVLDARARWMAAVLSSAYLLSFLAAPLLSASGTRSGPAIGGTYALLFVAGALSMLEARGSAPRQWAPTAALLASTAGLALAAIWLGALPFAPWLIALNAVPYLAFFGATVRRAAFAAAPLGIAGSLALDASGWLRALVPLDHPRSDAGLLATATLVVLQLIGIALVLGKLRRDLREADLERARLAWHLDTIVRPEEPR